MWWNKDNEHKYKILSKRINDLDKRVINLETKWKYNYLDEVALIEKDAMFMGYTNKDSFVVSDRVIEHQDSYNNSYYTIYYKVIVNKGDNVIEVGKNTLEEHFKLAKKK
jgi:predicted GNAT family N-acyltransferase